MNRIIIKYISFFKSLCETLTEYFMIYKRKYIHNSNFKLFIINLQ